MTSREIKDCTPKMQEAWQKALCEWLCLYPELPQPFLTCTHRSNEEQARLYAKGRTIPGVRVTNAKPGQSKHNLKPSPAFDIAFKIKTGGLDWSPYLFEKFAAIIKPLGVEWGGDWKKFIDRPHFQEL